MKRENNEFEEKRIQEFEDKKEKIREHIEKRKEKILIAKSDMIKETRSRVRKSPLHLRIWNEFTEHYVIPELERRKMALAEIRNFKQPIRFKEIRAHSAQKKELLKSKLQEYFKKREHLAEWSADFSDKYESKFWKQVKEREEEEKEEEERYHQEDIRTRHKRGLDYAKNVMSLYKPVISKKKQLEMVLIRKNMDDPTSLAKMKRALKTTQNKNHSVLTSLDRTLGSETTTQTKPKRMLSKTKPLDEKRYSYHQSPLDKHKFVKIDYLTDQRIKNQDTEKKEVNKVDLWQNEINKSNMNDQEKVDYIKLKSHQAEQEMLRKEKWCKLNNASTLEDTKKINGILIDWIKTKLNLLNDLN